MNFRSRNSSKTGKKMKSEEKRPEKKRPEEKKAIPNNKKRNPEGNQAGEPNFEKSETKERNPEGNQAGEPNLEKSETKERNPGENKAGEPNFEKSETRERKLKKNKADELKPEQRKTAGPSRGEKASGKARPKIGIGYRVAGLQVEEATGQRKNGYMVWRCRCGWRDSSGHPLPAERNRHGLRLHVQGKAGTAGHYRTAVRYADCPGAYGADIIRVCSLALYM